MLRFVLVAFYLVPLVVYAAECDVGYWLADDGTCSQCNSSGPGEYYCPGDDARHVCPPNNQDITEFLNQDIGEFVEKRSSGVWAYAIASSATDCRANIVIGSRIGRYSTECKWNGNNYFYPCNNVPYWLYAESGYYLSQYRGNWNNQQYFYYGVRPCTNAPANAVYTGAGTPDSTDGLSVDVNDCPWRCADGYALMDDGTCRQLCQAGFSSLRTSTGLRFHVFASRSTTPSLNFGVNGMVCYADLVPGHVSDAIHVLYNDIVYHTVN